MIITYLIQISIFIINLILSIFPTSAGFPPQFDTAINTLAGYTGMFSPILPLATLATVLSLIIAFELAVFTFKALKWLFTHVPLIGGRG